MPSEIEPMTLAGAIAYLKPDPASNGTISLRAPKAREAVERIEREFVRLDAIISDKVGETRLVHMGPKGDGFGIDLMEGPVPYLCEYLAQMMGHGSDEPLSNYAEIEVQHHVVGAMTLTLQRRAGLTPHQKAAAAIEEATRLRAELAALRSQDREDGARPDIAEALKREAQEQHFRRDLAERTYARLKEQVCRAAHKAFAGDDRALRRLTDTIENPKPIYGSDAPEAAIAALRHREQGEGSDDA